MPLSTYQTKLCKRASSCSIPRTSHRWWHFNGFGDGPNKNVDYLLSLLTLFAVQLLRPVPISTKKSSGHAPRHSSCYDSTVWSIMLWDASFSLGAVQLSPQWDHTLVLVSRNLCCDIRFQVTLSRLVSLAKCCSEQFGCHQSASVFCYQYPLNSLGISADSCARQLCDAHKISMLTTSVELVENSTITNPEVRGEIALSLCAFIPSSYGTLVCPGEVLMSTFVWSSTAERSSRFS